MITYQKKKEKKNKGLTQFYFNLLILKTTHFHTQLITQFQPFFLLKKKKNVRHVILFTSQLHINHIRENRRERGRKNAAQRDREKAVGDQSRRRSEGLYHRQESYSNNSKRNWEKSEGLYHRQTSFPPKTSSVIF